VHRVLRRLGAPRLRDLDRPTRVIVRYEREKAVQTDEWYVGDPRRSSKAPTFDFSQVHSLVLVATQLHFVAARWFAQHRIGPFMVRYEDLVNDVDGTLRSILAFLEIPFPEDRPIAPFRRQRDAVNAERVRRYRESAHDPPPTR
jgi:LPS sulfotransferase NodH